MRSLLSLSLLTGLAACSSTIEPGGSPTTTAGTSATGGTAGAAGGTTTTTTSTTTGCAVAADCPGADGDCTTRVCDAGTCGLLFTAAGTPGAAQIPGDCRVLVCDGAGALMTVDAPSDVPDDGNPCTVDQCQGGVPQHLPSPAGAACGPSLVCDGLGDCVGCLTVADCPGSDTECATRVCDDHVCGVSYAPLGAALSAQTAGDCQTRVCDGSGAVIAVAEAGDTQDDGNDCTADTCNGTTPAHTVTVGAACHTGGGHVCTASGACGQCVTAADCPAPAGTCAIAACTAGSCGTAAAPAGTPVAQQTAGDCAVMTCNGSGGATLAYDATDAPPGKSCPSTTWSPPFATCGGAVEPSPATSWADCSAAVYPGKSGGDLLWVTKTNLAISGCAVDKLAVGPTGDVVVGGDCHLSFFHTTTGYQRLDGGGGPVVQRLIDLCSNQTQSTATMNRGMSIGPTNDLFLTLAVTGPWTCGSGGLEVDSPSGAVISPPTYVSPLGQLKVSTSTSAVDLGCGSLPAAPGGSTFITRIDAANSCLYARALPVPGLRATLDPVGRVAIAGQAGTGAGAIDLGGGPLAPVGSYDMLLAELDASGNHLWSKRFGGIGATFADFYDWTAKDSRVSTSAAGNVYLVTRLEAAANQVIPIDLGGGVLTAVAGDALVASYAPSGAHRWSRAYHLDGGANASAAVDGCGSLDVLIPSGSSTACFPYYENVARFAP